MRESIISITQIKPTTTKKPQQMGILDDEWCFDIKGRRWVALGPSARRSS